MMKSLRKFIQIHRSIKQHATRFSAVVVVLLFGLFLEAYMHDFNLVYITLFFVFSLAFSAGPIGVLNLGNLETKFLKKGRFFAQVEGKITLQIYNNSTTTAWAITVHGKDASVPIKHIKAEKNMLVHLPYIPEKRGLFSYDGAYLESKYPLSTARLTKNISETYEDIAYPQPKGKSLHAFLNEVENHFGEEKEFDGLRAYDGSQKLSHIHWASVAKGDMAVKTFIKETESANLVFHFNSAGKGDESRLSQLCLWVLACEKERLAFEIQMPKRKLSSKKESIDEILEYLSKY
ncbi:MAG: hypothetical protein COA92_06155 [Sulfurovum sp.]|nr:MAG: hypothetical protein COA92_06155 [Sulfurovum sp.]